MPKLLLHAHPDHPAPGVTIEVELTRTGSMLTLTYVLAGDLDPISIPPPQAAARIDGLWKHTCFEAFLAADPGYYEFNFSPSGQWAAYHFDAHRQGMRDAVGPDPSIGWSAGKGAGQLVATLQLPVDVNDRIGLSAIVEDDAGNCSFWALAHPPGAPDFHHAACFAASLPPAAQSY